MRQFATNRALICWPGTETVGASQLNPEPARSGGRSQIRKHRSENTYQKTPAMIRPLCLARYPTIERPQYDISQVS
jgi:hypothetical protein